MDRGMTARVALLGSLLVVASCGGDREAPEAPRRVEAPEEVLELADDYVTKVHSETDLGDGVARIEEDSFDVAISGLDLVLSTPRAEEHWSVDDERWVAELPANDSYDDVDPVQVERNARIAALDVHLVGERGDEAWLPSGASFLLGLLGGRGIDFQLGVVYTDAGGKQQLAVLPRAREPYATFGAQVIARAEDDVWVFASETSGDGFDDSHSYCPISIRSSQDGGYVAHFDGARWRQLPWPAPGAPLAEVVNNADGSLDVVTGNAAEAVHFGGALPAPQRTFRYVGEAAPERVASPEEARAARLGWSVVSGGTVAGERTWKLPGERVTRLVARDAHEAFVQTVESGGESSGPTLTWYHLH
jgi:hypothetical protein